jgi:hypothetical protein
MSKIVKLSDIAVFLDIKDCRNIAAWIEKEGLRQK